MATRLFHPLIQDWFEGRFAEPTEPQQRGWPEIAAGHDTLIAAPTGSGKTLTAFLVCIDRLFRAWLDGRLSDSIQVVYISPLKALSNDIRRNLADPLSEITRAAEDSGLGKPPIRVAVRTGDTPASERQAMLRRPPHILVTTPESLYLLLTAEKSRRLLTQVRTVIVDEIHALARDKRGSHLSLSLERLASLSTERPVRIGLSATQSPIDQIARFLVGYGGDARSDFTDQQKLLFPAPSRAAARQTAAPEKLPPEKRGNAESGPSTPATPCTIINIGHARELDLAIGTPDSELSAVCSHEQWGEVYEQLVQLIHQHRSTLIFVNTRRLAERIAHHLTEILGEQAVASHHGSLSKETRLDAEHRLKSGQLRTIVATASLEMGIDIGFIDLVCQIGSPRSIATCLQRIGRSGHSLGKTPKGRLFPLTRDELLECMALVRAVRAGRLDSIEIPQAPLDILAQQLIAEVACGEQTEDRLFALCRQASPYRNLKREDFDGVLQLISEGMTNTNRRGAYLHRDRINGRVRPRKSARITALQSGGAIPENAEYRVITEDDETFVGTLDEDFAIESSAGDIFLLGNTSWRVSYVRAGQVVVQDAHGQPPNIPFWFGEAPGRTIELSEEISQLREEIAGIAPASPPAASPDTDCRGPEQPQRRLDNDAPLPESAHYEPAGATCSLSQLIETCGVSAWGAEQAVSYVQSEVAAIGLVPTKSEIVFERFFDESGGMQLVIHSPLGGRINRAWGLAMRKRFCRSFDFELQAAATDNGVLLSLSPQHSFPIEDLFNMLGPHNALDLLQQAILAVPMFQVRWRWNVTRALAVRRSQNGKKVPPHLQRFRSDDLLAAAFPETVGCLENHHGDVEIPTHPLVQQTMHDCLTEAMDVERWVKTLEDVRGGQIRLVPRDTREPSPFSHEILNANPYAFLDDAPLEERRTRAIATRRGTVPNEYRDLTRLDPDAIRTVRNEAWPWVRDADELHDALSSLVVLLAHEAADWQPWLNELAAQGRATRLRIETESTSVSVWIAAERLPLVSAVYETCSCQPQICLPPALARDWSRSDALLELVRGRATHSGPVTVAELALQLGLVESQVAAALEALEGQGVVMRGSFVPGETTIQWCDRRLLARIHRLTLDGLRREIEPVEASAYLRFLIDRHRIAARQPHQGPIGVREAVAQLQGFEMPAAAWERVLAARCANYDPAWLDRLFMTGETTWGRIRRRAAQNNQARAISSATRMMPICLLLREDLPWLLADQDELKAAGNDRDSGHPAPRLAKARRLVLEVLRSRGALFLQELQAASGLSSGEVKSSLEVLVANGLATSDTFEAVRSLVAGKQRMRRRRFAGSFSAQQTLAGRWSVFPPMVAAVERDQYLDAWCRQLLLRYGVLFRDVLTRETAAPAWHELVGLLRKMELRGQLRGGRFIKGVSGEQYAAEETIQQLRRARAQPQEAADWCVLSAADPLNLIGIVDKAERIAATHRNWIVLHQGDCVAVQQSGTIEFTKALPEEDQQHIRSLLLTTKKRRLKSALRS